MTDIPLNIPLAIPGGYELLHYLLIFTFIVHILFVAMMIGGTYWSILFVLIGRSDPFYRRLAKETLDTVTINKSIAVILGIAPLLLISLIYTIYWFPATQITYPYFLSIIWLVILAFLTLYVYKYTWYTLGERRPFIHLSFGLLGAAIFTVVPFIFLTNINLMLLPFRWHEIRGFFDALILQNVFQRYAHFMTAVFATIGFFTAIYFWFRGRNSDDPFFLRAKVVGLKWALGATLLQGIFGPVNFYSLPPGAYSSRLLVFVLIGVGLATIVCIVLIRAIQRPTGGLIISAGVLLGITAVIMSFLRDTVRVNLLRGPNEIAVHNVEMYQSSLQDFMKTFIPPEEAEKGAAAETGKQLFEQYCSSCHAQSEVLVGPSLTYMAGKYKGNPQEMTDFILNPVKVNPKFPQMPKTPLDPQQVHEVVEYILSEEWHGGRQQSEAGEEQPGRQQQAQTAGQAVSTKSGEALFNQHCSGCHAYDQVVAGPPETYMIQKYTGKEQQMVNFVLHPTKVNPKYPEMPESDVNEEQAKEIVAYILAQGESGRQ
jgi:cytochrome c